MLKLGKPVAPLASAKFTAEGTDVKMFEVYRTAGHIA